MTAAAIDALTAHDWPGNVRALRHACERAVILAVGGAFHAADFALGAATMAESSSRPAAGDALRLNERERAAVATAMQQAEGNISQAARLLGVSRAALYRKLDKHGL